MMGRADALIRTPDQRLRVFVSSTLGELAAERDAARDAITALRLTPVMFELGARPHPPAEVYRDYLSQSHIFIGIYGESYGWVGPGATVSGVEEELSLAAEMPRLLYITNPAPDRDPRLTSMIEQIEETAEITYRTFASPAELGQKIEEDLALLLSERFETGDRPSGKTRPVSSRSIAILPFVNLSGDPENEYFSDGVTETILTGLCRVGDLKVISRTSVMRYKGTTKSMGEVASELGVAHLVEGSVQRSGDRVRITAQLIDGRTDAHLWAETYDRDLEDIFAIQSDVAQRIVTSLRAVLTPAERSHLGDRPTESIEAYELYLKGRHFLAQRMGMALPQAVEWFQRAVDADPEFAQAWAGLADACALLPFYDRRSLDEVRSDVRAAADQANSIDPSLGEPHAALGLIAIMAWDWDEADRQHRRAIELSPGSAKAHHSYGNLMLYRVEYDNAIAALEYALDLDPMSLPIHAALGAANLCARRYDRAEAIYRKGLELDPDSGMLHNNLAHLYEVQGRYEEALVEVETSGRLNPDWVSLDRVARQRAGYAARGRRGYWEADLEWKRSLEWSPRRAYAIAAASAALGRIDEAIGQLDRLVERKHLLALQIAPDPAFDPLRSEPRFAELLETIGVRGRT